MKHVESLIGRDTVDMATLEALDNYHDHGKPEDRIEQDVAKAPWMLVRLPELSISLDEVT